MVKGGVCVCVCDDYFSSGDVSELVVELFVYNYFYRGGLKKRLAFPVEATQPR